MSLRDGHNSKENSKVMGQYDPKLNGVIVTCIIQKKIASKILASFWALEESYLEHNSKENSKFQVFLRLRRTTITSA